MRSGFFCCKFGKVGCYALGIIYSKEWHSSIRKLTLTDNLGYIIIKFMEELIQTIRRLADVYTANLNTQIGSRREEMKTDDTAHYLVYRVLGIGTKEGQRIDEYQNVGRFLYKYAGAFLEEATTLCLKHKFPTGQKVRIVNTQGQKPKTFEIDFLNQNDAIEVKWRDATTDGDHITKEHTKIQVIKSLGHKPIRIMFYYPQRAQAVKVQQTLKTLYSAVEGAYYSGDEAWDFVKTYSGVDLKLILTTIANERISEHES